MDAAIFERLIAELPIGVVVFRLEDDDDDTSLRLVFANAKADAFLAQPLSKRIGEWFSDVLPNVPAERRKLYADVVRTDKPYDGRTQADASGEVATFTIHAFSVGDRCVAVHFINLNVEQRAEARIRQLTLFLDSIIESLPLMIFVKDAEHLRFERLNRAGELLLGLERSALIGKSDYDFFPKEQADFFVEADRATLRGGSVVDIPEEPIQTANGPRWLHTRKVPVLDPSGRPLHLLGISEDITERRKVDQALETANKELEAFSYSVAHDLRAPLRAINGFSTALQEDYGSTLDEAAQKHLTRICAAATRMGDLIDDLLKLSRVGRSELNRQRVSVSDVARETLAELMEAHRERAVTPVIEADLFVHADPTLIRIAFVNLLNNAFKFTSQRPRARIEVGSMRRDDERVVFVRDDGAGFDMGNAGRLFAPFQRLHSASEFEGTGIGLAIVQRVVSRHGGRVWAESEEGKGATFYVSLPDAEK